MTHVASEICSSLHGIQQKGSWYLVQTAGLDLASLYLEDAVLKEETVSMAATRVVMHQIVLPAEVDSLGICSGGQVPVPLGHPRLHNYSLRLGPKISCDAPRSGDQEHIPRMALSMALIRVTALALDARCLTGC